MLGKGPAKRLTVVVDEEARHAGAPLHEAVLRLLRERGVAGAAVTRAVAGYTSEAGFVSERTVERAAGLPLRIEAVDAASAIEAALPDLYLLVDRGLITTEDVHIVKASQPPGPAPGAPPPGPAPRVTLRAKQLRVHISEKDAYLGEPLYEAIIKRFNLEEFAGLTAYRALEGFGAHHHLHRDGLFLHREAPIVLIMIDTEANVARARAILDGMLRHGAVVVSDVEATFYGPSAAAAAAPPPRP